MIQFAHHTVHQFPDERLVVTQLTDGAAAHACPHDTDDYRAHAERSGVGHDVDKYCLHHDLAHILFGEMLGGESPVLQHVARGTEFPQDQLDREEEICKLMQRYFNRYGWPTDVGVSGGEAGRSPLGGEVC